MGLWAWSSEEPPEVSAPESPGARYDHSSVPVALATGFSHTSEGRLCDLVKGTLAVASHSLCHLPSHQGHKGTGERKHQTKTIGYYFPICTVNNADIWGWERQTV